MRKQYSPLVWYLNLRYSLDTADLDKVLIQDTKEKD